MSDDVTIVVHASSLLPARAEILDRVTVTHGPHAGVTGYVVRIDVQGVEIAPNTFARCARLLRDYETRVGIPAFRFVASRDIFRVLQREDPADRRYTPAHSVIINGVPVAMDGTAPHGTAYVHQWAEHP